MTVAYLFAPPSSDDISSGGDHRRARPATSLSSHEVALADQLRAGSGTAYEAAIRTYYGWLYSVAMSYVHSNIVAEDVVDTVFARTWERRDALAPGTRLGVYLLVAVRHASLDAVRHQRVSTKRLMLADASETLGIGRAPDPADVALEHDELIASVWRAIETLPERSRIIMTLRWREQLEWPQIAATLGMSLAAAQMQHTRALKLLRDQLPTYLSED